MMIGGIYGATSILTNVTIIPVTTTASATPASCSAAGSATVTVTSASTPPYTYNWSPTGGTDAIATGLSAGTYTVITTDDTGSGCSDTSIVTVAPGGNLVANITVTPAGCGTTNGASTVNVTTGTAPYTYSWSPSGGNNSNATGLGGGNYSVTITDAAGCSSTKTVTVTSVGNLATTIASTPAGCAVNDGTATVTVSTGTAPYTYSWSPSGGNNSSATGLGAGNYTVTITDAAGCKTTNTATITVNAKPTAAFTSSPPCLGSVMSLTDGSTSTINPIASWNWSMPGGNPASSTSQNSSTQYTTAGTHSVTLVVTTQQGCKDSIVLPVTVLALPTAAFQPTAPCLGASTTLTDGSVSPQGDPVTSWSWAMTGGNPPTSTSQNTSTVYTTAGTNSVTLIVTTQAGCKDTIIQQVVVYHSPIALFNDKDSGCAPVCHTFTDLSQAIDGTIANWVWSFPGGSQNTSSQTNPGPICYNAAGNYDGSLIVTTSYGCKDTLQLTNIIHVYAWPHADFCIDQNTAPSTDPVFAFCPQWTPNPGVTNWVWNFGDGSALDSTSTNPVHSYSAAATANDFYSYNVCLKIKNQLGCWDTICKTVELIPEFTFYMPNTFTPNGDDANEFFFGKGRGIKDYNIWLFDRWGNMLWDCHYTGKNTDWDGTGQDGMPSSCQWDGIVVKGGMDMGGNSGVLAQEDVYVWKVKLTDVFDKQHNYIGHVSIIK
jgi:gliding motility-associated-like protein